MLGNNLEKGNCLLVKPRNVKRKIKYKVAKSIQNFTDQATKNKNRKPRLCVV